MIWKTSTVLSLALCVVCLPRDRRPTDDQKVELHFPGHHGDLSHHHHKHEHHEGYASTYPSYEFSYKVDDPKTHDKKAQHEERDGGDVTGNYWLIQPDGEKRYIRYHVDDKSGFTAVINYTSPHAEVYYNVMKHREEKANKEPEKKEKDKKEDMKDNLKHSNRQEPEKKKVEPKKEEHNKGKPEVKHVEEKPIKKINNNAKPSPKKNLEHKEEKHIEEANKKKISKIEHERKPEEHQGRQHGHWDWDWVHEEEEEEVHGMGYDIHQQEDHKKPKNDENQDQHKNDHREPSHDKKQHRQKEDHKEPNPDKKHDHHKDGNEGKKKEIKPHPKEVQKEHNDKPLNNDHDNKRNLDKEVHEERHRDDHEEEEIWAGLKGWTIIHDRPQSHEKPVWEWDIHHDRSWPSAHSWNDEHEHKLHDEERKILDKKQNNGEEKHKIVVHGPKHDNGISKPKKDIILTHILEQKIRAEEIKTRVEESKKVSDEEKHKAEEKSRGDDDKKRGENINRRRVGNKRRGGDQRHDSENENREHRNIRTHGDRRGQSSYVHFTPIKYAQRY